MNPITRYILQILLLASLYFFSGQASFSLSVSHNIVTSVIFAAEGFALAAVILFGTRLWVGVFLGQLCLALSNGVDGYAAVGVSVINSLEAVIGATLFRHFALQPTLTKIRDVCGLLLLIFLVLQPFSATLGTLLLWQSNILPSVSVTTAWFSWWFGNALGQVLITPLLLTLFCYKENLIQNFYSVSKPLVFFVSTAAILFSTSLFNSVTIAFAATVPLLILIAATGGMAMVNLATAIVSVAVLALAQQTQGMFAHNDNNLLLDLDGYLLSMALTGQCVAVLFSEYNQAHLLQQENLDRLQKIASHLPGMVFQFRLNADGSSCFPYCSAAIEEIFGLNPEEVEKNSAKVFAMLHPEDQESCRLSIKKSAHTLEPWQHECRICLADGSERWLLSHALPEHEEGGATLWHGFVTDITEQKKTQQTLQDKEKMLSEAQRIAHLGSWVLDIASGELIWSDEVYRLFELDPKTIVANYADFFNAIHWEDREAVNFAYIRSLETQKPYEIVHRLKMQDGRVKWVHEKCTTDFDSEGKPLRSNGIVQDITDHMEKEEALNRAKLEAEQANRAKSEFLSSMSHELRTPMNAVLGFAQVLESEDLTPEQLESVQHILTGGYHLMDLINEVLDLAKIETERVELKLEVLDVRTLVQNCLMLIQPLAAKNKINLVDDTCAESNALVIADKLRLKQVLLNLTSNAIKYNRIGGKITVSCAVINLKSLRINVIDTGKGLSALEISKLFQPFERLSAKNSAIEGTGIGLVISKKLIEAMNGSIGVTSTVGEGSCFWVDVPLA